MKTSQYIARQRMHLVRFDKLVMIVKRFSHNDELRSFDFTCDKKYLKTLNKLMICGAYFQNIAFRENLNAGMTFEMGYVKLVATKKIPGRVMSVTICYDPSEDDRPLETELTLEEQQWVWEDLLESAVCQ